MEFPCGKYPSTSTVTVIIESTILEYEADRLEGGQRLKMPPEATAAVVEALCNGFCIDVAVGRYRETLVPNNFKM
jgi:hypothetical protein